MRRLLQISSMGCVLLGLALWFFGGMNTGASRWTEDAQSADAAHAIGQETRHVFSPGTGFLVATFGLGAALAAVSLVTPKNKTDQTG